MASMENHTLVLGQLRETTEIAQRLRGDPNDSFVRVSELNSALGTRLINGTLQPPNSNTASGASVAAINSITGNGAALTPLQLVGDSASPGNSMVYGTNGSGVKGWYAAGGGGSSPLTTKGDLFGFTTVNARIPVGSNGQILTADSTAAAGVSWQAGGGSGVPSTITNLIFWFQADLVISSFLPLLPNSTPGLQLYSPSASNAGATGASSTLNSKNVVSFPGTNDSDYVFPGSGFLLKQSTTFMVFNPTNFAVASDFICGSSSSLEIDVNTAGKLDITKCFVVAVAASTTVLTAGVWFQGNVTYNDTTGAFAFRVARAAAGSGTNAQAITSKNTSVGFNPPGSTNFMNGSLAELIVYNRVLTPTEVTNVENYLFAKWGV